MKFKTFIAMYKNIIILIWWLVILVIFKIWNNFNFSNGNSILFIVLMAVFPLILYIFGILYKKRLLRQKDLKKKPFFEMIKNDFKIKKFQKDFLDKIEYLKLNLDYSDNKIIILNDKLEIVFEKSFAKIQILNTKIVFYFYYNNHVNEYTKYDKKMIQYHSTTYLYNQMLLQLTKLVDHSVVYMENKKKYKLIDSMTKEVLYSNERKINKKQKYNNIISIDLKK